MSWHFDVFTIKIGSNIERLKNGRKGIKNTMIGEKLVGALFTHFGLRTNVPMSEKYSQPCLACTLLAQLWSEIIRGSLPAKDTVKIDIPLLNLMNVWRRTRAAENMIVGMSSWLQDVA